LLPALEHRGFKPVATYLHYLLVKGIIEGVFFFLDAANVLADNGPIQVLACSRALRQPLPKLARSQFRQVEVYLFMR
jgi:hypothetical protein